MQVSVTKISNFGVFLEGFSEILIYIIQDIYNLVQKKLLFKRIDFEIFSYERF